MKLQNTLAPDGAPERIVTDPLPCRCKADRRSVGRRGLHQVGEFPAYERWAEWIDPRHSNIFGERPFLRPACCHA
jgi:pullulanase/glycogen debranching enzyme